MKQVVLPVGLVAIIGCMLLPLPPFAVDCLLVANLIFSILLVGCALHLSTPTKLSSLPTILLLATLYRLALNISTTRRIIGSGEAGEMIELFGQLLMQGEMLVGLVVFLVITLVQFIVIAKGSERVAEVSARFTLDALPGKQMSIDADLRAGLLDADTAKKKREELQIESRFYGALDGAMKFVKGDAIAGIVITAVNIIGGLAVGILIRELDFEVALQKYTLLTLGDGLLSQIPALLNSLAAGLVVTRVTQDNDDSLAVEVLDQLGSIKPALILSGTVSLLLALTGVATVSFLLMSGLFLFFGFLPSESDGTTADTELEEFIPKIPPLLAIVIPTNSLLRSCQPATVRRELSRMLKELYDEYGLLLPPPELQIQEDLETDYCFMFRGVQSVEYSFTSMDAVINEVGRATSGHDSQFVELCQQLKNFITDRRADCVDDLCTRRLLDHLEQTSPELVAHTVPGVITVTKLTRILRSLIVERINIKSIDSIIQALSEAASDGVPERLYLDEVRIALKRVISNRYSQNSTITGYRIDPIIDLAFGDSQHSHQQLDPALLLELEEVLASRTAAHSSQSEVILLTSRASRRALQDYLRMRGKSAFVVLSEPELADDITWVEKGQIQLSQNTAESIIERLAA